MWVLCVVLCVVWVGAFPLSRCMSSYYFEKHLPQQFASGVVAEAITLSGRTRS